MNPEVITKTIKAIVPLLALVGVEFNPEQVQTIVEAGLLIYSAIYAMEAFWKNRAGKQ